MNNYMKVIINAMKQWTNDKLSGFDAKFVDIDDALKNKVDSIDGKGLSTNDYTTEEKEKLANIEAGAQVNVQTDWNQNDHKSIDYIKNKPEITLDRVSLIDRGNGNKYHIYLYNGELIVQLACERIEVTTMPAKITYWADEQFDPTGMVVTAIYPDGRKQEIKDYTYSASMTSGNSVVTITYTEFGISYTTFIIITVDTMTLAEKFADFEYTINDDGSVTLDSWKGTYNGVSSSSCVIPDTNGKVQIIV